MAGSPLPARVSSGPRAPTSDEPANARALVLFGIAVLYAGAAVAWGLFLARQALLLVYLSALFAIGLAPLVRLLERRGLGHRPRPMPRVGAVVVVYVLTLVVGVAVLVSVLPTLVGQAQALVRHAPDLLASGQQWLMAHGIPRRELSLQEMVRQAPVGGDAVGTLLLTLWGIVGGVFGVVTIFVLSFYFLVETDSIFTAFILLFPRRHRRQVRTIAQQITDKVSGWLSGQVMVAGIIGVTTAVVLALLGVPYFYVLAVIAAVGELVPYVGPVLSAVPAIAVAGSVSWTLALATAAFFLVQQQTESNLVVPRLMSNQVGLSSVAVIVALLVGGSIFGVVGAILAVPTAAIVQVLFHELVPAVDE